MSGKKEKEKRHNKLEKIFTASVLACTLALTPVSVRADGTENSDTQSLIEKVAQLESEVAMLEELIGISGASDGESANADANADAAANTDSMGNESDPAAGNSSEQETQTRKTETDIPQFISAAVDSCNARMAVSDAYTDEQMASMSEEALIDYYGACVDAETSFYNRYANAKFSDKNLYYLCYKYRLSVERQKAAVMNYQAGGDIATFNSEWDLGYFDRAMALVELHDIYGAQFDEELVEQMRRDLFYDKLIAGGLDGNAGVPADRVMYVQTLLNQAGYDCGTPDGDCGRATVRAIRHFQEMYGTTVDGLIDDELIGQLDG